MSLPLVFSNVFEPSVEEAFDWYCSQSEFAAMHLLSKIDEAIKLLAQNPLRGFVTISLAEVEAQGESAGLVLLAPVRREIEVRVKDTGTGIPEHERTRVFDPFYQVDQSSTREQGGAGLGLAIVKRLVEAHQGRIRIESNQPRGAVFVLNFPFLGTSTSGQRARVDL